MSAAADVPAHTEPEDVQNARAHLSNVNRQQRRSKNKLSCHIFIKICLRLSGGAAAAAAGGGGGAAWHDKR